MVEKSEPVSVQVNVRIPPAWVRNLKSLASRATANSEYFFTVQDIIRECIKIGSEELERRLR